MASIKFPTLPTLPTFPAFDFSNLDLSKINLPKINMPNINMPTIDTADIDTAAVANIARDAAYVVVGIAVVALQRVQVRRRELTKTVGDQLHNTRPQLDEILAGVEGRLTSIDSRIESIEAKLDGAVGDLEKRLPDRAGTMLVQAHEIAKAARQHVRGRIVSAA